MLSRLYSSCDLHKRGLVHGHHPQNITTEQVNLQAHTQRYY